MSIHLPASHLSLIDLLIKEKIIKSNPSSLLGGVSFITQITLEAIQAFSRKQFCLFDALVREEACQLRAAKILDLSQSPSFLHELADVEEQGNQILALLKTKKQIDAPNLESKENPQDEEVKGKPKKVKNKRNAQPKFIPASFCQLNGLRQSYSENVAFIIESYFLTLTKHVDRSIPSNIKEATDPTKLIRFDNFDPEHPFLYKEKLLGELMKTMQKHLSSLSVQYLQEQASLLSNPHNYQVIRSGIKKDPMGRTAAPCFYSVNTLTQRIIAKQQHILIDIIRWNEDAQNPAPPEQPKLQLQMVDRIKRLYVGDPETGKLKLLATYIKDLETGLQRSSAIIDNPPHTVFVIAGNSVRVDQKKLPIEEYLEKFDSEPLETIIDVNVAQHAQYSKAIEDQNYEDPLEEERLFLAKKAAAIGCSKENQELYTMNHIYCDQLESALTNEEIL